MQHDDTAWPKTWQATPLDVFQRAACGISAASGPGDADESKPSSDMPHHRVLQTDRRTEKSWRRNPGRVRDRGAARAQIRRYPPWWPQVEPVAMAVAVQPQGVSFGHDAPHHLRIPSDMTADHKECRMRSGFGERIKNPWGLFRIGTVIERQGNAVSGLIHLPVDRQVER